MSYFGKSKMHTIDHYITDQDNNKKNIIYKYVVLVLIVLYIKRDPKNFKFSLYIL